MGNLTLISTSTVCCAYTNPLACPETGVKTWAYPTAAPLHDVDLCALGGQSVTPIIASNQGMT